MLRLKTKQGKGTENGGRGSILHRVVSEDFLEEAAYKQEPK